MAIDLDGKVALVTGGASGIGRATAVAYARAGAKVVVADLDEAQMKAAVGEVEAAGGEALAVKVDVSSAESVAAMVDRTVETFGRLDYACNNAGIGGESAATGDYTVEGWDRVIAVNLRGVWLCMKHELPQMLEHGGSIINMASILGKVGFASAPAYVAAKHGVVGLTKTAALEYAAQGVRINAVCPAFIETPMLEQAGMLSDPEVRTMLTDLHPIGRLGQPEEVAHAVVWLSSDEASFVTGHALLVDGGYTAR